ncbi:hypothetical protein KQX54_016049 [Cotesia glomerata]|uniref:UBP24/USP9X/USP9Y ubiquitin-like domain-containing protein n=1 Tax=Cotesia glomerata TaxID=32391 RepID=A0AAV7J8J1_COTGL|nr:hypothetical protein KQX54_016049 [Cotesia glomerata]
MYIIDIYIHSNDTLASLRRQILRRRKANCTNVKLDLYINGESLDEADDRKLLSQIPLRDKMLLSVKLSQMHSNIPSSLDGSSGNSTSSPHHPYDDSNVETEYLLHIASRQNMLKICAIIKIAWAASTGNLDNVDASTDVFRTMHEANQRDPRSIEANDILG